MNFNRFKYFLIESHAVIFLQITFRLSKCIAKNIWLFCLAEQRLERHLIKNACFRIFSHLRKPFILTATTTALSEMPPRCTTTNYQQIPRPTLNLQSASQPT